MRWIMPPKQILGWKFPIGQSADDALMPVLATLQGQSSDLVSNECLASAAINNIVSGVVSHGGLRPQPQPDAKLLGLSEKELHDFAEQAETLFLLWAGEKTCDFSSTLNFWEMESLVLRSCLEFGDVLVVRRAKEAPELFSLNLQLIEAQRIATPLEKSDNLFVRQGIELDRKTGQAKAFYIRTAHNHLDLNYQKIHVCDELGSKIIHLAHRKRISQTRGTPILANVIPLLKQLSRYMQAETEAAVLNSYVAFVTKTKDGSNPLPDYGVVGPEEPKREIPSKIAPNTNVHLQDGEDIQMLDPKRPSSNFDAFITSVLKSIGAELEIPYEVLLGSFTSSYSASRAAMIKAHQTYRIKRKWLVSTFHKQVWEWFITECVAKKYLHAPGFFESSLKRRAFLTCEWIGDSPLQLDPSREAQAAQDLYNLGIITKKTLTQMLTGQNYDKVLTQLKKEASS
jgi:lambda family phage portal protein